MSKIQQQRQNAARGSSYPGTFEAWRVRPVFIVQCFVWQAAHVVYPKALHSWFRTLRPYKREAAEHRKAVADFIRAKRATGMTATDVRQIALGVIDAEESYAGVKRTEAANKAREVIAAL